MPRGPPRWTSDAQRVFLEARLEEFYRSQHDKKLARFWDDVYAQWFTAFPEEQVIFGEDAPAVATMSQEQQDRVSEAETVRRRVSKRL